MVATEIMGVMMMNNTINHQDWPIIAGIKTVVGRVKKKMVDFSMKLKKTGEDDPRRILHSVKVGLALTLVSLFYYFRPLYDGFGLAGMWAVLTVVVVFEFTVGGTLSKCLNRGFATLVAGALGVGAEYFADLFGKEGEPVVLGLLVFLLAAFSSFMRFVPNVKRRYDYGVLIFILTFSLVAVSGYRVEQILQLAHQRVSTILIGAAACMLISIFCCPVWAGQDLHNMVAANIEKLAAFLEGFGDEFFISLVDESTPKGSSKADGNKSFLEGYKSLLNSKATEESLANFAWWEPHHGKFRFHHPWKQYLKTSSLARECACHIETLDGLLKTRPKVKTSELELKIQDSCKQLSAESGKALRELASAIKTMTFPSQAVADHIRNSEAVADELTTILESCPLPPKSDLQEFLPVLVTASVLMDNIKCVEKISLSVHELSQSAHFRKPMSSAPDHEPAVVEKVQHRGMVKPVDDVDDHMVVIEIVENSGHHDSPENASNAGPIQQSPPT